jgi:superfamily II DNA or RNA helicase
VHDFVVEQDLTYQVALSAKVKGSHAVPYKQLIAIKWQADYKNASIAGRCSCPVGYNCKHVAAVCFEYQQRLQREVPQLPVDHCLEWLDSLVEDEGDEFNRQEEFLAYIMKWRGAKQEPTVDLQVTKLRKNGDSFTKGRHINIGSIGFAAEYGYGIPSYMQAIDLEIARLLSNLKSFASEPQLKGAVAGLALEKMLRTGRLFWQTLEQPIFMSETRRLLTQWHLDDKHNYQLSLSLMPEAQLIVIDPPYYYDSTTSVMGLVDTAGMSTNQIQKLLKAPPVPEALATQFSQRLVVDYPYLELAPPKPVAIQDLPVCPPIARLTLQGRSSRGSHFHVLKLQFDYDRYTVDAYSPEPITTLPTETGFIRIYRDQALERLCFEPLNRAGFSIFDDPAQHDLLFYMMAESIIDSAQRWQLFLDNVLPLLEQQGWRIETDTSFQLAFQAIDSWDAEIEEGRNDWFEMRFSIDINGQAMPLLPLLMPVLEHYDIGNLPERLTVAVEDHHFVTLPSDKLKPFLRILYEVFGSLQLNDNGSLKVTRFDAAGLATLESHAYGVFSLKGGEALRALGQKLQNFTGIAEAPIPETLQAELRSYQRQGLNWLQFLREYQFGGILADDMGLGKTVQTLSHLLLEKTSGRMSGPCLIIAPTSLMSNWRREAERFTPDLRVLVLQGSDRKQLFDQIVDTDLVLTTYPLLPRDEETLLAQRYYYLILDEAQTVKNPAAKAAKIVRAINAEHRLCLTGTPMENHLGELWTQFDFLMPGFLGDSSLFKRVYRTPIEVHGDGDQRQALAKRVAPFMLRRRKSDVVAELPAKTEIIRAVPLGEKQAMLYESIRLTMEQRVQAAIAEKGLARSHITILDALLKLRQTCCDPRTLPLAEAKKLKESAKLELLMEMLPELLDEGHRILVFSQFTRMLTLIEAELNALNIAYSKLTGQTQKRDEAIQRFKSGEANVFLISLKAGGVGLNLTEADTVIVYDPWWNPAAESQAADRAHRLGQEKPVFVYKLITENTVEEKILAMQARKRSLADGVYNGGKQEHTMALTSDDLSALFQPLTIK